MSEIKCMSCKHYEGPGIYGDIYLSHTCKACPEGIPQEGIYGDPQKEPVNSQCTYEKL